jgi:hypothetical protein
MIGGGSLKKVLYYICKAINWSLPFLLIGFCGTITEAFLYPVIIGYFLFAVFCWFWKDTKSRLTYQIWFFLGYIIGLYNIYVEKETVIKRILEAFNISTSSMGVSTAGISEKIVLTLICLVAFASKITTMVLETDEYNAGSISRHNNRLDHEIYSATYDLEHAHTAEELRRAEAKLERAKLNKEKYYLDE